MTEEQPLMSRSFMFSFYLARHEPSVIVWDRCWEEFCQIPLWNWRLLEDVAKQDLEVIIVFKEKFKPGNSALNTIKNENNNNDACHNANAERKLQKTNR